MSSEIIQSVAYDNYDDFQHVNFIFSQIFTLALPFIITFTLIIVFQNVLFQNLHLLY